MHSSGGMENVRTPRGLQGINFGAIRKQNVDTVALPSRRHSISLGEYLNDGIENMTLWGRSANFQGLRTFQPERGKLDAAERIEEHH